MHGPENLFVQELGHYAGAVHSISDPFVGLSDGCLPEGPLNPSLVLPDQEALGTCEVTSIIVPRLPCQATKPRGNSPAGDREDGPQRGGRPLYAVQGHVLHRAVTFSADGFAYIKK